MKLSDIVLLAIASPASASSFFQDSKADRIKANMQNIGYEILDSTGLVKDSVIDSFDSQSLKDWFEAHGINDASQQTLENAKKHKDWLLEDIKEFSVSNKDFAHALIGKGKEFFGGKAEDAKDAAYDAADGASQAGSKAYDAAADAGNNAYDAAANAGNKAAKAGSNAYDAAADAAAKAGNKAAKAGSDAYDAAADAAADAGNKAAKAGNKAYDAAANAGNKAAKAGSDAYDAAADAAADAGNKAAKAGSNAYDAAADAAANVAAGASGAGARAYDAAANAASKISKKISGAADQVADVAFNGWSDSKLKEFLDARGVEVPQGSTRDELNALAARAKHNMPLNNNGPTGRYWFDGWSRDDLVKKLEELGESVEGSRKDLADRAYSAYRKSVESGKQDAEDVKKGAGNMAQGAADAVSDAASAISNKLSQWKQSTADSFSSWSLEDLKDYLEDFGEEAAGTKDDMVKRARYNYNYFSKGQAPSDGFLDQFWSSFTNTKDTVWKYFDKIVGSNAMFHNEL